MPTLLILGFRMAFVGFCSGAAGCSAKMALDIYRAKDITATVGKTKKMTF